MPINKKLNVLFVHVPKCGGTTIEKILNMRGIEDFYSENVLNMLPHIPIDKFTSDEYFQCAAKNPQHYTYKELSKFFEKNIFENFYKISVVRNPYDRLVSEFHYCVGSLKSHSSFSEMVHKCLSMEPMSRNWLYDGHIETQTSYLMNEAGNLNSINKIYKFEEISRWLDEINNLSGNVKKYHLRKTPIREPWENYYTEETKTMVYNFYKEDFNNFGYDR